MKLIELIPQVFYDAIGRIASGLILLATAGAIWYPELTSFLGTLGTQYHVTAGGSFLALLLAAYAIAFVVEGVHNEVGDLIERVLRCKWKTEKERDAIKRRVASRILRESLRDRQKRVWSQAWGEFRQAYKIGFGKAPPRPEDAVAIDVIRLLNAGAGARIVKLRAEKAFCQTLKVGWSILLMAAIVSWWAGGIAPNWLSLSSSRALAVAALLLAAARAIGARHDGIDDRHLHALYNHWLLLVDPGAPGVCKGPPTTSPGGMREPPALSVSFASVQQDPKLQEEGVGARKLLVTEVYESSETPATQCEWRPPRQGEKCQVLKTTNIEAATFSEKAGQSHHWHGLATEIYLVLTGQMKIEVGGVTYTLGAGDMIVINPGTPHKVLRTDKPFLCRVIAANCRGRRDKHIVPPEKS